MHMRIPGSMLTPFFQPEAIQSEIKPEEGILARARKISPNAKLMNPYGVDWL